MNKLKIKSLLSNYPYNEYRNYKIISKELREEFLYKKILDLSKRENVWVIRESNQKPVTRNQSEIKGLIILEKQNWDTRHFGIQMGKIEYVTTRGDSSYEEDLKLKDKLIKQALKVAKENKIRHITAKIDCADNASVYVLEKNGFQLMDTILTYIFTQKHEIPNLKELYKVRDAKEEDLPVLMEIARRNFRNSRFHRDPNLPKEKAGKLYAEWIKNAYYKEMAEFVLVAEKAKYPIGFFTCKLDKDLLKYIKIKCLDRGLAACLQEKKMAYISLLKNAVYRGKEIIKVDLGEFETQIYNYSVIKTYQRFGMELVRSRYILHKLV